MKSYIPVHIKFGSLRKNSRLTHVIKLSDVYFGCKNPRCEITRSPGHQAAQANELCKAERPYLLVLGIVPASCRHSAAQNSGGCPNFCVIFVDSCIFVYILVNFKYLLTV